MRWMRLPDEYCGEDSGFFILPVPYEQRPTFGAGASKGAAAIIEASDHLEYYDEQFDCEPFLHGIKVLEPVDSLAALKPVGGFTIALGGDHAVTIGIAKRLPDDVDLLILDAHADMKFSWNDSQENHACVAKRLSAKRKVGIIGVRSMDVDEARDIAQNRNVRIIKAYDYDGKKLEGLLRFLGEKVYLSIDVDVFDPSFIRNTGTPEPGGLVWEAVIGILQRLFAQKQVVGADIVEFAPQGEEWHYRGEAYALARLAYKIMALKTLTFKNKL